MPMVIAGKSCSSGTSITVPAGPNALHSAVKTPRASKAAHEVTTISEASAGQGVLAAAQIVKTPMINRSDRLLTRKPPGPPRHQAVSLTGMKAEVHFMTDSSLD